MYFQPLAKKGSVIQGMIIIFCRLIILTPEVLSAVVVFTCLEIVLWSVCTDALVKTGLTES